MFYTGRGDDGTTSFFGSCGKRVSKASPRSEALGACDELNSLLGFVKIVAVRRDIDMPGTDATVAGEVERVQQDLFIIQGELAGAEKSITQDKVRRMEEVIRGIENNLPPVTTFRIAGGTELSALLDYARAVSRRVERRTIAAKDEAELSQESYAYLNRLSSLLYALARLANAQSGITEQSPAYE